MATPPLIFANGQIQRAGGSDVVMAPRWGIPHVPLTVTGDFTMTAGAHWLDAVTTVDVRNIYGAEPGEVLFLFGDNVRLRNSGGNLAGLENSIRLRPFRTALLYFADPLWITMSEVS